MSRQSARKIKLTSKFEDFTTTRLASIQRQAHTEPQQNAQQATAAEVATPVKVEKVAPLKIERETVRTTEASKTLDATPNHAPIRDKTPHKILRHKVATLTPATPAIETPQPSTPYGHITPLPKLTANGKIRGRPRKCWQQKAETVVKPISTAREELLRLREENISLRSQLEQKTTEFEELKRQSSYTGQTVPKVDFDDLKEKYQRDITHAKRHEWCVVCLNPSRYYCCWNTTYCSQKCQVSDWYSRHIKSCERRRAVKNAATG